MSLIKFFLFFCTISLLNFFQKITKMHQKQQFDIIIRCMKLGSKRANFSLITNVFFPQKILELSKNIKYGLELNSISVLLMALSTIFFLDLYKKEKSLIIAFNVLGY